MAKSHSGLEDSCKDCKWWQLEPAAEDQRHDRSACASTRSCSQFDCAVRLGQQRLQSLHARQAGPRRRLRGRAADRRGDAAGRIDEQCGLSPLDGFIRFDYARSVGIDPSARLAQPINGMTSAVYPGNTSTGQDGESPMFTNFKSRLAILGAALAVETTLFAQDAAPLPRPPLQPLPKEFQVPRPDLGVPDGIPVAAGGCASAVARRTRSRRSRCRVPKEAPPSIVIGAQSAQDGVAVTKNARVVGKIFRVDDDRVVVETNVGGQLTLHVDKKTEYLRRAPGTGYVAMVPGAEFTATYEQRGERLWITAIDIATNAESRAAQPVPVPPTIPVAIAPYEGEIVRVVGPGDQIVVRNLAGVELPITMTPQTRYELGETAGVFGDLRPGMRIRLEDEMRAERRYARRVLGVRR